MIADEYEVNWLDTNWLGHVEIVKEVGEKFKLHPLVIEDILNIDQI